MSARVAEPGAEPPQWDSPVVWCPMPTSPRSRPVRSSSAPTRSIARALSLVTVLAVLLGVFQVALAQPDGPGLIMMWVLTVAFWLFVGVGVLAWQRRPSNPMGFLLVWAGLMMYLGTVANTGIPFLVGIGTVCATLVFPAVLHLLLAFPSGRLGPGAPRQVVVVAYVLSTVFQAPLYVFDPNGPFPPFALVDAPALVEATRILQAGVGALVTILTAALLLRRLRAADGAHRRVLIPLFAYGVFAIILTRASGYLLRGVLGVDAMVAFYIQVAVLSGVPVAFGLGMLRGGFARVGEIEELGTWLGSVPTTRDSLATALARTLGDPTLSLAFWAETTGEYVDADGRPAPPPGRNRGWHELDLNGRPIGAIDYDAALLPDVDLIRTAAAVAAIAMDRERLTAELRARSQEVQRSRERLVEAADRERRRIARDLHDGLQARLVMVAVDAQRLGSAPPDALEERATRLRQDIDDAAADLRRLVHDLVPAALIERGLYAAAEELVDRMPIPTRLEGAVGGLGDSVADTAYFVVSESLANVVKHARAASATVRFAEGDGAVQIDVIDDGVGGADPAAGSGLRGLADRVAAAGGTLTVFSSPIEGTRVCVELPSAS